MGLFMRFIGALICLSVAHSAGAQKRYDPGVSDTEIRLGQTMPYSGPASSYSVGGKVFEAYFRMLNEQGGINGRKVTMLTVDDGYSPPKTLEQTRKLVERDEVLAMVASLGTPTNAAVQKYLNAKKVPQMLVLAGAARWNDPKQFPWTTPGYPNYVSEARIYGQHAAKTFPAGKYGLLYQNDDSGRDFATGFKLGLGSKVNQIVKEVSFEATDPTVDSQIIALKAAGVDVLFSNGVAKAMVQAARKIADLGWSPKHYVSSTATSAGFMPSGLEYAKGIMTTTVTMAVDDPEWKEHPEMKAFLRFMKERLPALSPSDGVHSYMVAHVAAHVLRAAGDNLTRENVLKQATSIKSQHFPLLLPGVTLTMTADDYTGFDTFRLQAFDGARWVAVGEPVKAR